MFQLSYMGLLELTCYSSAACSFCTMGACVYSKNTQNCFNLPRELLFWLSWTNFLSCLVYLVSFSSFAANDKSACELVGALAVFFSIAESLWIDMIVFYIYHTISSLRAGTEEESNYVSIFDEKNSSLTSACHGLLWGTSLIMALVLLVSGHTGAQTETTHVGHDIDYCGVKNTSTQWLVAVSGTGVVLVSCVGILSLFLYIYSQQPPCAHLCTEDHELSQHSGTNQPVHRPYATDQYPRLSMFKPPPLHATTTRDSTHSNNTAVPNNCNTDSLNTVPITTATNSRSQPRQGSDSYGQLSNMRSQVYVASSSPLFRLILMAYLTLQLSGIIMAYAPPEDSLTVVHINSAEGIINFTILVVCWMLGCLGEPIHQYDAVNQSDAVDGGKSPGKRCESDDSFSGRCMVPLMACVEACGWCWFAREDDDADEAASIDNCIGARGTNTLTSPCIPIRKPSGESSGSSFRSWTMDEFGNCTEPYETTHEYDDESSGARGRLTSDDYVAYSLMDSLISESSYMEQQQQKQEGYLTTVA